MSEQKLRRDSSGSLPRAILLVAAVCLVFAVMQGVHDNYGIMLNSLVERTGLDYAAVSFIIGVGALLYGVAQPFMGMLALKKGNAFVMLLGMGMTAAGLITTPLCRSFPTLLLCFGILLPKTAPFAFIMTGLLGATGDSTVPPTSGTISRKFGARKMAVLYGFALVGHQIGAFASASLGGVFVRNGMGYMPLWIMNLILAAIAATASYAIREEKKA